MSQPFSDNSLTNLSVTGVVVAPRVVSQSGIFGTTEAVDAQFNSASIGDAILENATIDNVHINNAVIESITNEPLNTAVLNNGLQFDNIQQQEKINNHRNFLLSNTIAQLTAGLPLPTFPSGRTITFNNMTSSTVLDFYLTIGYPQATPAAIIPGGSAVAPGAPGVLWTIPAIQGWSGNFSAFPTGTGPFQSGTLVEFGLNQLWSGATPPLRDVCDISNVPAGIGTLCNLGPHIGPPANNNCQYFSLQSGFSNQQSLGYNIGARITPTPGSLQSQTVTATSTNGDSPESIGFPNDTAYPKQQTIELTGNFIVDFLDPVVPFP